MQMKHETMHVHISSNNMNGFKEIFKALTHFMKIISSCKFHNKNKSTLTMNMKEGMKPFWTLKVVCSFPSNQNEWISWYIWKLT